ncbi:MAG: hypothetical protein AABZ16_10250, partial [candidate division NC10 bacterium]
LLMQNLWGWRGAFIGAGILGVAVAALLLAGRASVPVAAPAAPRLRAKPAERRRTRQAQVP